MNHFIMLTQVDEVDLKIMFNVSDIMYAWARQNNGGGFHSTIIVMNDRCDGIKVKETLEIISSIINNISQ